MVNPLVAFDDVATHVAQMLSLSKESLTPERRIDSLAVDSFRLVEMSIALQEEYDVIFTRKDLSEVSVLGDLADLVNRNA